MFRAHVLIVKRSKLHYTASCIIKPIGGRLVHETATYRCEDTRGCVMQFWSPDDEHMCSKHVEAWNKLIVKQKFCLSSWLITEIIKLRCTVSKTSKFIYLVSDDRIAILGRGRHFTFRHRLQTSFGNHFVRRKQLELERCRFALPVTLAKNVWISCSIPHISPWRGSLVHI